VDFSFFPFAIDAIKLLNKHGILAILITNQSHISKGYFTYEDYERKIEELKVELSQSDAHWDGTYCCPHTRTDNCKCMKPLPGMVLQAVRDFDIDLSCSYVIGDMGMSDMVLAKSIGAKGILVRTGVGEGSLAEFRHTWEDTEPYMIADNVLEAVRHIVGC